MDKSTVCSLKDMLFLASPRSYHPPLEPMLESVWSVLRQRSKLFKNFSFRCLAPFTQLHSARGMPLTDGMAWFPSYLYLLGWSKFPQKSSKFISSHLQSQMLFWSRRVILIFKSRVWSLETFNNACRQKGSSIRFHFKIHIINNAEGHFFYKTLF